MKTITFFIFIFMLLFSLLVSAQEDGGGDDDFLEMDLESLMNVEVTTASKKAQNIDEAPAAVTVISKEDLKYYGVNNLGEALRLVPGLEIQQGGDANYEVAVRGYSRSGYNTSNKVLWLVDGRSAYFDGLGGFRMESCPIAIDDIERIEVIRGSGSALYGANAFSGIVNIITKDAKEDGIHGTVVAGYGNLNQINTTANITGKKNKLSYKMTLGYKNIDQLEGRYDTLTEGKHDTIQTQIKDSLDNAGFLEGTKQLSTMIYGNMAVKYELSEDKSIRFSGGFSDNKADYYYIVPGEVKALDFFAQIDYTDEKNSFRGFYNSTPRFDYRQGKFFHQEEATNPYLAAMNRPEYVVNEASEVITRTMDYEYQRNINIIDDKLTAIAGASFRANFMKSVTFSWQDSMPKKNQQIVAAFTQIDYKPIDKLNISIGGRIDNHTEVGTNFNPKIAAVYKASDKHIVRAGFGTATRNPHFFDNYLNVLYMAKPFSDLGIPFDPIYNLGYNTPYIMFNVMGSTDLKPEQIKSTDMGYIFNVNDKLQIKFDAFYNITNNAIQFGTPEVQDAFIGALSTLENIHLINPAFGTDLSALAPYNGGVDPSVPNNMTKTEMEAQITELTNLGNGLINAGQPQQGQQLLAMAAGLQQVSAIYDNNIPRMMSLPMINSDDEYTSYGAELGFTFIPVKGLTIMGNYAYFKISDNYNDSEFVHSVNGVATGIEDSAKIINSIKSPEHKINLGVKVNVKKFYGGIVFNYMSEFYQNADNNRNGTYDTEDMLFDNEGLFKIDARMNLNVNLGYQTDRFDVFVTGYNLIQSDYKNFYFTNTIWGADLLNARFLGGVRVKF